MASEITIGLVEKNLGTQNQEIASMTVVVNTAKAVIEMTQMMKNMSQIK